MEQQLTGESNGPANLRADVLPIQGYVLTVDGKLKGRYETEQQATVEASKLKQRFPVLQVGVYDAVKRIHTLLAVPVE
jgi:hypothetical protein